MRWKKISRVNSKKLNMYLKCEIIVLLIIFIFLQLALPALASSPGKGYYESKVQLKFNDWNGYDGWTCEKMAPTCEEFFEQMGLDTYLIYGHRYSDGEMIGHVWVIVMINGNLEEFEATKLQFQDISEYTSEYVQYGRFINGIEQPTSTSVDDSLLLAAILSL